MNIAIISPNKDSYSETFIKAQKDRLKGRVFYYYDGFLPRRLEGNGSILIKYGNIKKRLGMLEADILSESVIKSFKKNKIEIVLAHYGPTGEAVASICKKLNIPLVVHFHGYDASVRSVILRNNKYVKTFDISHKVIAVSKTMVKDLQKLGCPKHKLVYNPCAPDPIFYKVQPNYKNNQFIAIGRFTDKKAPYYTILAFSKVIAHYSDAKLIYAGQGELFNTCKNLVKYLGIEASVDFKGVINQIEFKELLQSSIAFVQHSITAENGDKEGTPVAVLEASLAGLPVIATKHAGIPDVIIHNKTGLLSEEHDVDTMVIHMKTILADKNYAQKLGEQGKIRINNMFNMSNHISNIENVLFSK